jgi:hypothetical protein
LPRFALLPFKIMPSQVWSNNNHTN